jgi:nucleoside-diphosphate-sugar epimerase
LCNYALSTAKLRGRSDAFFLSMKGSIAAFHADLDAGRKPALDAAFGAGLISVCARIAEQVFPVPQPRPLPAPALESWDVAVLGGTGFIGTHTVRRFVEAGHRVAVMARGLVNLPAIFSHPNVMLIRGDIRDAAAVARAIGPAKLVVNLAHGGGGADFAAISAAMVGGAENVARACAAAGVRRLVHVGSIASLYLGPQPGRVTGATPPDPQETNRGDYAHAKVLADRMLLERHGRDGLPVVILRPGVVVGEGGSPFHSALGFYNNDQHCIGWNAGKNPLPFVLVEDVADAIYRATMAEAVDGRCFNIVGDIRPPARTYTADLARALGRPLRYHPQSPRFLWLEDYGKWLIKRITGRVVPAPSMRDFLSRGMLAEFDCTDAKQALDWHPVADPQRFAARAILVHVAA